MIIYFKISKKVFYTFYLNKIIIQNEIYFLYAFNSFSLFSHIFMRLFSKMCKNSMFIIEPCSLKSVRWIINDLLPRSHAVRAFFLGLKLN